MHAQLWFCPCLWLSMNANGSACSSLSLCLNECGSRSVEDCVCAPLYVCARTARRLQMHDFVCTLRKRCHGCRLVFNEGETSPEQATIPPSPLPTDSP